MKKEVNALFIGNSYTFYQDMPEAIFAPMMQEAGFSLSVERLTKGGQHLMDSADPENVLGAKVDVALRNNRYDVIVLQEQSHCPMTNPGKFYDGVRKLFDRVKKTGAQPYFYCTWGRKPGSDFLEKRGLTHEEMTWRLAASYTALGRELEVPVAYVGYAFSHVLKHHKEIELYKPDCSHPSYAGSFLAALTLMAKITGVDPTALSYCGELDQKTADLLKKAAHRAVLEPVAIPGAYQTASEGVIYVPEEA